MFVVLVMLHVDRSCLISVVETEGQNVSRTALFLGVDVVRAMWMAYGHPEAAYIRFQRGGLCLVTDDTLSRQQANWMFQPPGELDVTAFPNTDCGLPFKSFCHRKPS